MLQHSQVVGLRKKSGLASREDPSIQWSVVSVRHPLCAAMLLTIGSHRNQLTKFSMLTVMVELFGWHSLRISSVHVSMS